MDSIPEDLCMSIIKSSNVNERDEVSITINKISSL